MMDNAVIDKIKKLLRMKNGGTPAEVETALSLAQTLAAKHGIDISAIDTTDNEIIEHTTPQRSSMPAECYYASGIVDNYFNVYVIRSNYPQLRRYEHIFIGKKHDIEIAVYVYNFLIGHFRRQWNLRRTMLKNRSGFIEGMFYGLCRKLKETQKNYAPQYGIVLANSRKALEEYVMNKHNPVDGRERGSKDIDTEMILGYEEGLKTNIRKALVDNSKIKMIAQ
jgi:hypothetical protein